MVYFILSITAAVIFSWFAEKNNSKLFLVLAILSLVFVAGCRAESVGIDTTHYYNTFKLLVNYQNVQTKEAVYAFITRLIMKIFKQYWVPILIYSGITWSLLLLRFWDFHEDVSFTLLVVFAIIFHLSSSMNIMRQYIGAAVVFYFSRYLEDEKYIKFLIGVLIGACFHFTSVVGVALIPMMQYSQKHIKNRRLKLFFIILLIVPFCLIIYNEKIGDYTYFINTEIDNDVGVGLLIKLGIVLSFLFASVRKIDETEKKDWYRFFCIIDILYIALRSLGYTFIYMSRIGKIFGLFELVLYAAMVKCPYGLQININEKNKVSIYSVPVLLFTAYTAYITFSGDGNRIFPYMPFWAA